MRASVAGQQTSSAQTRVWPSRETPQASASVSTIRSPKPSRSESGSRAATVRSAGIVDLQAQHAVADRGADAHGVVGAQPGVLDAVGHQLGHHQFGIGEHATVDASGQGVCDH